MGPGRRVVRLLVVGALLGVASVPIGPVGEAAALSGCSAQATVGPGETVSCAFACESSRGIRVKTLDTSGAGSSLSAAAACGGALATCVSGQNTGCSALSPTDVFVSGAGTCTATNENPSTRNVYVECDLTNPWQLASFQALGTMTTGPLQYPAFNLSPGATAFTLTSTVCTGTAASSSPTSPALFGTCNLTLAGTLLPKAGMGPWCNWAGGVFAGGVSITGGFVTRPFPFTSGMLDTANGVGVATAFATGGGSHGTMAASVSVVPDSTPGQTCVTGATQFIVTFSGVIVINQ